MVTVKSCCTVTPSKPTPNGRLWLSECDQIKPWTLVPIIYIYRPPTATNLPLQLPAIDLLQILRLSLSQALVPFYPLAGRLHWTSGGGRLELDCNAMGGQLLEAVSDETIEDLGDFCPSSALMMKLVPKADYNSPIETWPLFQVQLTKFRCGGVSVGVSICHSLADGFSGVNFVNSWAKLARGESLENEPFHDRTLLRRKGDVQPRFDHEELQSWPLLAGCSDDKMERKKETVVAMLRVTRKQIEQLKHRANETPNDNVLSEKRDMGRRPYSTFEVLVAHVWRCACLARPGDNSQETRHRILVDCRNRLNPPLPKGYFGNASLPSATPTCVFGDLRRQPLSYAAGKIREASEKMTDEYIKSALDFVTRQESVSGFRTSFRLDKESMMLEQGTYLGNPNMSANTWVNLPFYDADFGWGKPVYVGPPSVVSDGKFIIMRTSSDYAGPVAIAICLQTSHMDSFKKYFFENLCV